MEEGYIVENDLYENIVKYYLTETRWKEVFLLISGLLRGKVNQLFKADHLLLVMEKEAHDYLKTSLDKSKLVPILQWADEMTKDSLDSPIKPVGRRAIANVFAITKARAIANPIAYAAYNGNAYIGNLIAYAYAYTGKAFANAYIYTRNANANANIAHAREKLVELANLFVQDRIFSSVKLSSV